MNKLPLSESLKRTEELIAKAIGLPDRAGFKTFEERNGLPALGSVSSKMMVGSVIQGAIGSVMADFADRPIHAVGDALGRLGVGFHLNRRAAAEFGDMTREMIQRIPGSVGVFKTEQLNLLREFSGNFNGGLVGSLMAQVRQASAFAPLAGESWLGSALADLQRISCGIESAVIGEIQRQISCLADGDERDGLTRERQRAMALPEELSYSRNDEGLRVQVSEINADLIEWLDKHPEKMRELPPRKFEELIAELFKNRGCEVQLTPQTRDGGFDIFLTIPTAFGPHFGIVECKRNAARRKIDVAIVERFIYTVREKMKANVGFIAATTTFSQDAMKEAAVYKRQLRLLDFAKIKEMVSQYGKWHQSESAGLWLPLI